MSRFFGCAALRDWQGGSFLAAFFASETFNYLLLGKACLPYKLKYGLAFETGIIYQEYGHLTKI
ncbi:MAG: hypothetical protein JXB29_06390 [Sedimentisphaerales bacterium]|nr:hypothetical protein [Sedimentisphaerales bacterium]